MNTEPTNCQKCNAGLDRGYSFRCQGNEINRAVCFECADKEELQEYLETKTLRTGTLTRNFFHTHCFFTDNNNINWAHAKTPLSEVSDRIGMQQSLDKITSKIGEFEKEVWYRGVQKQVSESSVKGISAKIGDFSVLTYTMCGRTIITFDDGKVDVSAITLEDETSKEGCMGWRGIYATEEQALKLIDTAIQAYKQGQLVFQEDDKVSYL